MKRITITQKLIKTYIITDEGEEILIEVGRKNKRDIEYLTLTGNERIESLKGWRELDKLLRPQLKSKKENDENK